MMDLKVERKVLAEKSVIPLVVFLFSILCLALIIYACVVVFDYRLVAGGVFILGMSVWLIVTYLKRPMLLAEFDGEKIILYPTRGKTIELVPEDIINVSGRRGGKGSFLTGTLMVRTKKETYNLGFVNNIYKAENAFLEIIDKKDNPGEDDAGE